MRTPGLPVTHPPPIERARCKRLQLLTRGPAAGTPNALNVYKMNTQTNTISWPTVEAAPGRPLTMGQELGAYLARMDARAARIGSMLAAVETIATSASHRS